MKKIHLFVLLVLCGFCATAQTGSISGKITDSTYKKTMPFATITVFTAKDTSIVTYRLCDPNGSFKIPGLPVDTDLRFMVTFSGYEALRQDFRLSTSAADLHFDSLVLTASDRQLDDVIVFAERPPVMIKKDTIEFNASAFKTLPNALVEDLLKKLPGVSVDRDGNIMVNGKPVNRILVDGKTFFGDDPKMATRNLTANMIDKVQVTDDKEEMARNGDDNLNNVGKVVNITLKKGVKKGLFGKLYAGAGTQHVHEAGGILNVYRDTLQISLIGYTNNLNRPGFSISDLMQTGGFQRSNSTTGSSNTTLYRNNNGSSISVNGISFGGSQNFGGVAGSNGAGININHSPNTKKSFFLQYFNGNTTIDRNTQTATSQYNADTIINNNTSLNGDVLTHAHNFGIGAKLKPDSVTTITASANYTIGLQNEDRFSDILSNNNKLGPLSEGNIDQNNATNTYSYRHGFSLVKASKTKKGRRVNLMHNLDINNRYNDFLTESQSRFLFPIYRDSLLNQLRNEKLKRTDASLVAMYSEPVTKFLILRFSGRYDYSRINNDINTFNKSTHGKYEVPNKTLSNVFDRQSNLFNGSLSFEFKVKDITLTPIARVITQTANNQLASVSDPVKQQYTNFLPGFNITWKQLNFNYSKGVFLPAYTYLLPVTDNTNPYFITRGNVNLVASKRNNYSVNYFYNNPKKLFNVGLNGGFTNTQNDVIQSLVVDEKGVQTSTPVNANGTNNGYLNYNINRQYKIKTTFSFNWSLGAYYSLTNSQLLYNGESSRQRTSYISQWAGGGININDKFEWNTNYSITYNFTNYTSPQFKPLQVINSWWDNEFIFRMPKHFIWETQLNYIHNGSLPKHLQNVMTWNAALNITMLKGEKGVLRLSAFDLLNKTRSLYVNANANVITTRQTNVLPQYFMATFTYHLRPSGEKKKIGGQRLLLF